MTENAPPGKAKGLASIADKAPLNDHHHRPHHHEKPIQAEIVDQLDNIKACNGASGENLERPLRSPRHLPARLKAAIAAERSMPKMHWRWRLRGRDIVALLQSRFGSALPDDDAGADAAKLIAQHYMRLKIDAERVTRANLRLWASGLTEKAVARLIADAKKAKTPSAAQLGKHWRVTASEVAGHGLTTITAFTVTLEGDRNRQARRRRNAGAAKKRGRPSLNLSPEEKRTRRLALEAERKRRARASAKKSHAGAYIRGMKRDELMRTRPLSAALDLAGFNPAKFGITGIQVMSGNDVLQAWERAGPGRRSEAPGIIR